jgi:hypothetical protein
MYFPRNREFGLALSKFGISWRGGGGLNPPPPVGTPLQKSIFLRQAMEELHDVEVPSRNRRWRARAVSTTYSRCVSVVLVIQHAPCYTVTCGLSGCTEFFLFILTNGAIVGKKKNLNIKNVFWFSMQISTFLILRWFQLVFLKINVRSSLCKMAVMLIGF